MSAIKGIPFLFKGVKDVSSCKTSEDVMVAAGLNWEVAKCELVAKTPARSSDNEREDGFTRGGDFYIDCPNAYSVYRTDTNQPLGVVKGRYTPVQNIEAFKFFDSAIGKDKAIWQTAGCFGNGERVFVSAKLPNGILINGEDPVDTYLVFTTTHDGTGGVKALLTPIRVYCENTLNAAIGTSTNYVSFRHTKSVLSNMDSASELLGICKQKIDIVSDYYEQMYKKLFTDKQSQKLFASVILSDIEISNITNTGHTIDQIIAKNWSAVEDSGISMKKVNTLNEINNYYFNGPGQREILGTGWGAYNAVTGYYSNVDNAVGLKRMDSLLYGDKSNKIETTGNLVLNNHY